jgi:hypothetical protein
MPWSQEPLTGPTALVMIRPTGVKLTSNGSAERHLSGRVTDVAFRGRGYEHAIDINGTTRLTGVFADVRGQEGRDRRPAHGSGRLSPVPGRALENFG